MDKRLAQVNFSYCEETIKLKTDLELTYLELASRLHKIQSERMYEPNYDDFGDFLEDIKLSPSVATKMVKVWETFVLKFKVPLKKIADAGGVYQAYEVIKFVDSRKSAEEWLLKAKTFSRADLRKDKLEAITGIDMATCKHKDRTIIKFWRCNKCGDTGHIHEDEKQT